MRPVVFRLGVLLLAACGTHNSETRAVVPLCDAGGPSPGAARDRARRAGQLLDVFGRRLEGREPAPSVSAELLTRARNSACEHVSYAAKLRRAADESLGVAACHTNASVEDKRSHFVPLAVSSKADAALFYVRLESDAGPDEWESEHIVHATRDEASRILSTGPGAGGATARGLTVIPGPTGDFDGDGVLDVLGTSGQSRYWALHSLARTTFGPSGALPPPASAWNGHSNPAVSLIVRAGRAHVVAVEGGIMSACARGDYDGVHVMEWSPSRQWFVRSELGGDAKRLIEHTCEPIRVLADLEAPGAGPASGAALVERRSWLERIEGRLAQAGINDAGLREALRAEAGVAACGRAGSATPLQTGP